MHTSKIFHCVLMDIKEKARKKEEMRIDIAHKEQKEN